MVGIFETCSISGIKGFLVILEVETLVVGAMCAMCVCVCEGMFKREGARLERSTMLITEAFG